MARPPNAQQLLVTLLVAPDHPLAGQLAAWLESPSFRAFAHAHESKIRRKIRLARDTESQADLAWELEAAHRLAQQQGVALIYELGGVGAQRGVDFMLTFKGHSIIGVEATRMRATEREPEYAVAKIGDVVLAKLGQLRADAPNLLIIQVAASTYARLNLDEAFRTLVQRVDRREESVMQGRGFENPAAFHRLFRRLSATLIATPDQEAPKIWLNSQCQRPLSNQARNTLVKAFQR